MFIQICISKLVYSGNMYIVLLRIYYLTHLLITDTSYSINNELSMGNDCSSPVLLKIDDKRMNPMIDDILHSDRRLTLDDRYFRHPSNTHYTCSAQDIESELHFLTEHPLYLMERNELFDVIFKYIPNVFNLTEEEKFSIIMSSEIKPITDALGKYVYKCLKKKYEIH